VRVVLGIAYRGSAYRGWQSQPGGRTVQDHVDAALSAFADVPLKSICAGRTDAGVHALNQVVHFDADVVRERDAWVRGSNRYLPADIAVQWCRFVPASFHSRASAIGRRYVYVLLESPVRPAVESGLAGWTFRSLDGAAMQLAARALVGEHDFSAFRSSECQALSPVKTLRDVMVERHGAYWRIRFDADAFLHHMIRNIVGALVYVGAGKQPATWVGDLLAARDRARAAPTFAADGLYLTGADYDAKWGLPATTAKVRLPLA
jgi:tRNA pseudouridine38-40 synthase